MKMFKVNGRRIAAKTIADAVEAYKANKEGNCKDASGVDFDYLLAEERKAVNDYRTAISQTDDPKLLTVLSHILKEETEHIEELEAARKGVYEDKGLMDAEVLTRQERIRFVEKLTAGLQKPPYNYDKMTANEIAIKRADALDPQWRARWGGDVEAQVRQELRNTAPKDSVKTKDDKVNKTVRELWEKYDKYVSRPKYEFWTTGNGDVDLTLGLTGPIVAKGDDAVIKLLQEELRKIGK